MFPQCAADATSKFIYDFDIYCAKNMQSLDGQKSSRKVANLGYKVVMELIRGLEKKGHVIVMDNFFYKCRIILRFGKVMHLCHWNYAVKLYWVASFYNKCQGLQEKTTWRVEFR